MKQAMLDAGFGRVDVFADFTFNKARRADERVRDYVFVGKKK
jgi:hypothetical protein